MEKLTFKEISKLANKDLNKQYSDLFKSKGLEYQDKQYSKIDIYNWMILNGYTRKRIQKDKVSKYYYIKD